MTASANADSRPATTSDSAVLHLPDRSVVVLAGLPGAGKTTLLRRLTGTHGVLALDSEDVAERLRLVPVPYGLLRPLVHALHLLRVAVAVHAGVPCVLTTDPFTSRRRRQLLGSLARLSGRSLHVVVVHASLDEARDGRRRRGRDLSPARVARHERRYGSLPDDDVRCRLSRDQASRALVASVGAPNRPSSPTPTPAPKETSTVSTTHRRRRAIWIPATATALGLWFGLAAPAVSPVLPTQDAVPGAPQALTVLDADDGPDGDGDGRGRGPDGPR